jgi:plasmid maintenance system killer protein
VIVSFRDKDTRALAAGQSVRRFRIFEGAARRKLRMLEAATQLGDLASPPGNRLEALRGDRRGSTAFASMADGESASSGSKAPFMTSKSLTIIDPG